MDFCSASEIKLKDEPSGTTFTSTPSRVKKNFFLHI